MTYTPKHPPGSCNVHLQCSVCNNHLSGNLINYRTNLVKKIGLEHVELLEGPQEPKRYRHEEILAIKAKYKLLTKELMIKIESAA